MDPEDSRVDIERIILHFRRLVADPGVRAIVSSGFEWFSDTLAAAEARWGIDNGRSVMPDTLAALAGVKPKTLANLIAAGHLGTDGSGHISAAEALQYLSKRKGFIQSSWQIENSMPTTILEDTSLQEQVFIPVDADGGPFLPSLARRGPRRSATLYHRREIIPCLPRRLLGGPCSAGGNADTSLASTGIRHRWLELGKRARRMAPLLKSRHPTHV